MEADIMNKEKPLISVIVPVYKVEQYLHRCVDSILAQTYTNLEIILIDDGSPDRSGEICDEYAAKDSRIRVIHQENAGVSAARNAGLDVCTGEYIGFVDSDDCLLPEMYEKMLVALIDHQVDISICHWQYEYADGRQTVDLSRVDSTLYGKMSSREFARFLFKGSYENGMVVSPWNKLYKRDFFQTLRFSGKYMEDDVIHSHIFSREFPVFVVDQQFYIYMENTASLSHQHFRPDSLRILDIMAERTELYRDDPFIVREAKRFYCNIYIEDYYKAKEARIPMPDRKLFARYVWDLLGSGSCSMKFVIRMLLFLVSPALYRFLVLR